MTYKSVCHLRSQSANAQVDYRGACVDKEESRQLWEVCHSVRNSRRLCKDNRETCRRRVLSKDGCCPICGTELLTVFVHYLLCMVEVGRG